MTKPKMINWETAIGDTNYAFQLIIAKEITLKIDNKEKLTVPVQWINSLTEYCLRFRLDGHNLQLIIPSNHKYRAKNIGLVEDGCYISGNELGREYHAMPKWPLFFIVSIIPISVIGGLPGVLFGVTGFSFCIKIGRTKLSSAVRVILCLAITVAAWCAYYMTADIINDFIAGFISG